MKKLILVLLSLLVCTMALVACDDIQNDIESESISSQIIHQTTESYKETTDQSEESDPISVHTVTCVDKKEATCTEEGNIQYWYCGDCQKYFSDAECQIEIEASECIISSLGHSSIENPEKSPTCTEDGNVQYWYCSVCQKCFSDDECQIEIAASECIISSLDHDEVEQQGKTPTCSEVGWDAYVSCTRCSYNTRVERTLNHEMSDATCMTPATCKNGCGYIEGEPIEHDLVDKVCTVCEIRGISNVEELRNIDLAGKYILLNNLDLNGIEWTPIGNGTNTFKGFFDGNGFVISNFKTSGERSITGVFGGNDGVIKNLGIDKYTIDIKPNFSTGIEAGGLVGYNNSGTIENCYVIATVKAVSKKSNISVGGLVGFNKEGIIKNCYATVDIKASISDYSALNSNYAGGLVGKNTGTIISSNASGKLSAIGRWYTYAGGLSGNNEGDIKNCYASVNIDAETSGDKSPMHTYAGGLVGYNDKGSITNCYAVGNVDSYSAEKETYSGGLVGYSWGGTISNCYATGDVVASSSVSGALAGGLVGWLAESAIVSNCYRSQSQSFERSGGRYPNHYTYYSASNTEGIETTLENLKDSEWVRENLGGQ